MFGRNRIWGRDKLIFKFEDKEEISFVFGLRKKFKKGGKSWGNFF